MVTKLALGDLVLSSRLILAKIHMVTKQENETYDIKHRLILAKIHMVTKRKLGYRLF